MDVKLLKNAIEVLKNDLEGSLMSSVIWKTGTGTAIMGFNENPAGTALFDQVTSFMKKALKGAEFPNIGDYYLLNLENGKIAVILQFKEGYQWGILIDGAKVNLGLLLNVAVPNAQKALKEAIAG